MFSILTQLRNISNRRPNMIWSEMWIKSSIIQTPEHYYYGGGYSKISMDEFENLKCNMYVVGTVHYTTKRHGSAWVLPVSSSWTALSDSIQVWSQRAVSVASCLTVTLSSLINQSYMIDQYESSRHIFCHASYNFIIIFFY